MLQSKNKPLWVSVKACKLPWPPKPNFLTSGAKTLMPTKIQVFLASLQRLQKPNTSFCSPYNELVLRSTVLKHPQSYQLKWRPFRGGCGLTRNGRIRKRPQSIIRWLQRRFSQFTVTWILDAFAAVSQQQNARSQRFNYHSVHRRTAYPLIPITQFLFFPP